MISTIRLQNFRSYTDASFEFEPGVNIVVGPNASGKTNLLEAVMVLTLGGSFRGRDAELVRFGKSWCRLDGNFQKQARTVKIETANGSVAKDFVIDGRGFRRLSLDRTVPIVLFEPGHLQLLSRGPDGRRDYFDELLERSRPAYKSTLNAYRRTLAQRNALLKHGQSRSGGQLFAWNVRLSELGSQVAVARQELVDQINQNLSRDYSKIAKRKSTVNIVYDSQFPVSVYASRLLSKLEASTVTDFERGFTGHGPHREDFIFELNSRPASQTASRGETRSLLLSLKIFELGLLQKARGVKPIFLLDDVFSELDGARRRALVSHLRGVQTVITTTDADTVVEYFNLGQNLIAL
ncbi:MAG TPA: DNA replication and repair protein RecF [Candidatus Saccharimonadales bacterium]|nr:DNA replication and repair protein RecF [Candidatus Saccharimonadales bacterium]